MTSLFWPYSKQLITSIVLFSLLILPLHSVAHERPIQMQVDPPTNNKFLSPSHRLEIYHQGKLNYRKAIGYSLALPGLGNFYAEQYFTGGLAITAFTFSVFFVTFGLNTSNSEFLWLGGGLATLTYGGAILSSAYGVQQYNRQLQRSLNIDPEMLSSTGMQFSLPTISFRF